MKEDEWCCINQQPCDHNGGQRKCGSCSSAGKYLWDIYDMLKSKANDFQKVDEGDVLQASYKRGERIIVMYIKKGEPFTPES